jgi:hypothetical protein
MLSSELIAVREFPAVVQAGDIAVLRAGHNKAAERDFIGGYLGFDERANHALSTSLRSLASQRGGAFFLSGVFGSGKSHLLGLLALLCDDRGHEYFLETHPHCAPLLQNFPRFFVTYFSLDEYDAARFSLEEIVRREIEAEWQRRFAEPLQWPQGGTRGEYFLALEEQLSARGCQAMFIGMDELSLFLSAKEHRALQGDAAFLQFLGQRAARSTPCPLQVFAALQKTVDDIGDLEAYSLSQIRDRFVTLPLSLAHLPSLIERRLIIVKDAAALQGVCRESYEELHRALPHLEFGHDEWRQLYPFHPATVALLEQVVARFFSRTRSAALFCTHAAQEQLASGRDATARILPDALFDYLAPGLESHPDLRPLATVWSAWRESVPELAGDDADAAALLRLMKTLLLFKIAGAAPSVLQLANAVALDAKLEGERNYEYARLLLERLRLRGSFLAVERNSGDWSDRYAVDLGTRVTELARRHIRSAVHELQPHDARIAACVLDCCHDEPLPLAALAAAPQFPVLWRNAPREIAVLLWQRGTSTSQLANRAATLGQAGTREDLLLFIAPPFAQLDSQLTIRDLQLEARWRNAVLLWTPRAPTDDERRLAQEATAAHLLEGDPQLLDNRRGRAILGHIKESAAARERQMAQLAARLLREGRIVAASGLCLEAVELSGDQSWTSTLEALAEFALPHVFERFEEIAPRLRVLTPANAQALCLEILRRPATDPYFAAAHERLARALAEPFGIARADKGRWKIAAPRADLAQELLDAARESSTLAALEAHFSKSDWGLTGEQLALVVCALLRGGELVALDARGHVLPAAQIGLPLRRAVHTVRPGQLLDAERWSQLQIVIERLTQARLGARSFPEQEQARRLLAHWKDEAARQTELAQARLNQLRRALNGAGASWPQSASTLSALAALLEESIAGGSEAVLARVADLDVATLQPQLDRWRRLIGQLEAAQSPLLAAHALLTSAELSTPPPLQAARGELLLRLQSGEAVLEDDALPQEAAQWREAYAREYRDWHEKQNHNARWNSLRRLLNADALRFLDGLSTLRSRRFAEADAIHGAIQSELDKQCPRDGALLPGAATCNACGLRFGARVCVRDAGEIESQIARGLAVFHAVLQEPPTREYLARREAAQPLLMWNSDAATLPALTDEVLALLEAALKPRRRVARSVSTLAAQLRKCRTREEFESAFATWLDGGEGLANDDEIELA